MEEIHSGGNEQYEDLLAEYKDVADALLEAQNDQQKKSWMEKTEGLNFIHSIRRAWALIKRLGLTK